MTLVRATTKLLKRLRQTPSRGDPDPGSNPLGEWYADIFFVQREPVVLMLNAATCAALLLPGRAAALRELGLNASLQFETLLRRLGIVTAASLGEAAALRELTFARTANRSLVSLMNQRKLEAWIGFHYHDRYLIEAASKLWETPFNRKGGSRQAEFAVDLVRAAFPPGVFVEHPGVRR